MNAVSTQTRTEVWQLIWNAKRCSRYYQGLRARYQARHWLCSVLILLMGGGCVTIVFDDFPDVVRIAVGGLLAVFTLVSMLGDFSYKSAVAAHIALQCDDVERRGLDLWAEINAVDSVADGTARAALNGIREYFDFATHRWGDARGVRPSARLNRKAAVEAKADLLSMFNLNQGERAARA